MKKIISPIICVASLLFMFSPCKAKEKSDIEDTTITLINSLPKELVYEGKVKEAINWADKEGKHIAFITETGIYVSEKFGHDNDGADAEIFAYHYLFNEKTDRHELKWKIYDYISDCPVDIAANFIENTFKVTDLDNNGIHEVWVMYQKVCHGDVSPFEMKVIMYEGNTKYAMRGENKIQLSDNESFGGEYKFDNNFTKGKNVFREYARKIWSDNIMVKWE
ncbi:hypothetical protein G7050_15705 [Dysgonomonas sp. HDW5A]|uniref:M949_RS01915 family surface polysaccharide biosynthesis protein n=1 Tax=Dysgonomonas sp. HDW5A TaxID=2714926 RepID=UPI00140E0EEB|nr:hypothetical protein [Dysgonomonas sp. HDW5A]QIK61204.1 hypothetical protein G7050_15705 [Dysgonomonas sp. HDW5A]